MNRNLALAAASLALLACSPDFDPASKIEKLRVLGVKAEPPEIAPPGDPSAAHTAAITSLVLRADFDAEPARTTTVAYVACVPIPGDTTPSDCVVLAPLRDPTVMLAGAAQASCAAPQAQMGPHPFFAGVEVCSGGTCGPATAGGTPLPSPELAVTTGVAKAFKDLPDAGPEKILGVQAVVLAFALDATPDELVQGAGTTCPAGDVAARLAQLWPARDHVLSTKRVVIRGPDLQVATDPPNQNPRATSGGPGVIGIRAGGADLVDPDAPATTLSGGIISLTPILAPDAEFEPYNKRDASGAVIESTTEAWTYSWFSTAGDLDELHTHGTDPDDWTVSGAPGGTPALVAVVVRDLRGGMAWQVRRVNVTP